MMFAICTLLSPTTRNKVSNRCYHVLGNIGSVHNLNWCKFVVDQLHVQFAKGKYTRACMFYFMFLTCWRIVRKTLNNCRTRIKKKTCQTMKISPLKMMTVTSPRGADSFEKWMEVHTAANCSNEEHAKVAGLMVNFASGMVGLMSVLVKGWTDLQDQGGAKMAHQFGFLTSGLQSAHASSATARTCNAACQRETVAVAGRWMTRSARATGVVGRTGESRLSAVEFDSDDELRHIKEDVAKSWLDGSDGEDARASLFDGSDAEDGSSDEDDNDGGVGGDDGVHSDVVMEMEDEEEDGGGQGLDCDVGGVGFGGNDEVLASQIPLMH